jgi:syringomycin synthetase protein SyrE
MNDLAVATKAIPDQGAQVPETGDAWIFPTSLAQRRLWFIDQLDPGNTLYNVPAAFRVRGHLDPALLERSFAEIIARHEILRTTFRDVDGEPMQIVAATSDFHLPPVNLRALPASARDTEVIRIIREESERPFDLRNGPLLRAALLDLAPSEQVLVLCLHQIITDCWSQDVLMRELTSAYSALVKGAPLTLPELPIQYADFAAWQREAIQGEVQEKELAFWRENLTGLVPLGLPHLPTQAQPSIPEGAIFHFDLPETLSAALRAMARSEGVTLFMALLAGWKIFLARYTGQTDIAVGSPIADRGRTDIEGLIGFFLNTLILRTGLADNPTVRDTLRRVRGAALDAFTHQNLPFEMMIEYLQPTPLPGKNPLLRVMFLLMTGEEKSWRTPDGVIEPLPIGESKPRFDLMLRLRDTGRTVTGALAYDTAVFTPALIHRIASQYKTLLSGMAAQPEIGIDSLSMEDLETVPPNASSQVDLAALAAQPILETRRAHENPGTWLESALVEIWEETLNRRPIAVTDDFFDLGGHSILAIRMLAEVEQKTGIKIAPRLLFEYPTIRNLAIAARRPAALARSAIIPVQTGGPLSPFFFLHGDFVEGGLYCIKMARHIGQDRPFYAIDPHGVHDQPPHSIEEMAAARLELVRQVRPRGPYVLGGYCNGGLVAFEMARQLEAAGETVSSLVLLSVEGSNAEFSWLERLISLPPGRDDRKFRSFLRWRERILFARAAWKRHLDALTAPVPISSQPRRFARKVARILRKAFGLMLPRPVADTPGVDTTQPEAAGVDIGLIYHQACTAYVPRPYRGPAHVLWPSEMTLRDPFAGWGSVMPQIKLFQVPGGHFSFLQGENLLVVSEQIRASLLDDHA